MSPFRKDREALQTQDVSLKFLKPKGQGDCSLQHCVEIRKLVLPTGVKCSVKV